MSVTETDFINIMFENCCAQYFNLSGLIYFIFGFLVCIIIPFIVQLEAIAN